MLQRLDDYLATRSPTVVALAGLALTALIGILDYLTGPDVAFSIFYLLPVALAAWSHGFRMAAILSAISAIVWIETDLAAGAQFSNDLVPVWNTVTRLGVYLIVAALLSHLRDTREVTRELAQTDPLTGVANSRMFHQGAVLELARARRFDRPVTLAYIDLDDFKRINDTLGHSVGDAALVGVAAALRRNTRTTDLVARLGGDEFALLLPETDATDAAELLSKLVERVIASVDSHGLPLTFSVGVVTFVSPPESADAMVQAADRLMYDAKRAGKNCIRHSVSGRPHTG